MSLSFLSCSTNQISKSITYMYIMFFCRFWSHTIPMFLGPSSWSLSNVSTYDMLFGVFSPFIVVWSLVFFLCWTVYTKCLWRWKPFLSSTIDLPWDSVVHFSKVYLHRKMSCNYDMQFHVNEERWRFNNLWMWIRVLQPHSILCVWTRMSLLMQWVIKSCY
jgi:hypothetical protein